MHCRELETYCFCYISSLNACNGMYVMDKVCVCLLCWYVLVCCCFQTLYGLRSHTNLIVKWNKFAYCLLAAGPQPLLEWVLQTVQSGASSFNSQYLQFFLRFSSSFFCPLPHFLDPCIFYIPLSIVQVPSYSFQSSSLSSCALNHNILFFEIPWYCDIFCQDIPSWPCLWLFSVWCSVFCSCYSFLHCWHSSNFFVCPVHWSFLA